MTAAEKIVAAVLGNLHGRSGYDHLWDSLDEDIQQNIRETLTEDVQEILDAV